MRLWVVLLGWLLVYPRLWILRRGHYSNYQSAERKLTTVMRIVTVSVGYVPQPAGDQLGKIAYTIGVALLQATGMFLPLLILFLTVKQW